MYVNVSVIQSYSKIDLTDFFNFFEILNPNGSLGTDLNLSDEMLNRGPESIAKMVLAHLTKHFPFRGPA